MLIVAWLAITAPLSKSLQPIAAPSMTLVSVEGDPIARRGADIREPVSIKALPKHVPAAFIAIEDKRFHDHLGISIRGIARAAWRNLGAGGVREGGSTITQQLAKISFLSADRTAARKAQEVLIAFWLEAWLTKEEILERYLSNVYLGDNTYGLRAASQHYFSVPPEKLTVPQAAMLAGDGQGAVAARADPQLQAGARQRGRVVIAAMIDQGYLTNAEARRLKPARLKVERVRVVPTGTYFADWVLPMARARGEIGYGEQEVQTTLESRLQKLGARRPCAAPASAGRRSLWWRCGPTAGWSPWSAAATMRRARSTAPPRRGASPARRSSCSSISPPLRAGMTPDTPIADTPLRIGDWQPQQLRRPLSRHAHPARRLRPVEQRRRGAAVGAGRPAERHPRRPRPRREEPARRQSEPRARNVGRDPARADLGLCRGRRRRLSGPAARARGGGEALVAARLATARPGRSGDPAFDEIARVARRGGQPGHRPGRGASQSRPSARPGRPRTTATPCSSASPRIWWSECGSAMTTTARSPARSPAAACRRGSGAISSPRRSAPAPAQSLAPPLAVPVSSEGLNGSLTVPIEGTGYEVGFEVTENGVTISAQPGRSAAVRRGSRRRPRAHHRPAPRTARPAPRAGRGRRRP